MCLLEKQEIFWKQRAKQFWLREGDKNLRFFHKLAFTRREHNNVKRIKDANSEWRESENEVQEVITKYFSKLFQYGGWDDDILQSEKVCLVTNEQNKALVTPVTA